MDFHVNTIGSLAIVIQLMAMAMTVKECEQDSQHGGRYVVVT